MRSEIMEDIFRLLDTLTKWPVIFLFLFLLFRRQISNLLPELAKRVTKFSPKDFTFEFNAMQSFAAESDPTLVKETLLKLSQNALGEGEADYVEELTSDHEAAAIEATDEETTVSEADRDELSQRSAQLQQRRKEETK